MLALTTIQALTLLTVFLLMENHETELHLTNADVQLHHYYLRIFSSTDILDTEKEGVTIISNGLANLCLNVQNKPH